MLEDPSPSTDDTSAADELSWQERELIAALRRLANARSQYASLKEEADAADERAVDDADVAALERVRAEIEKTRPKSRARFGGGAARERMHDLEGTHRQILERMGFATYSEFVEWQKTPATVSSVDPALLDFAQRELDEAEAAWQQISVLEIPEPEAVEDEPELVDEEDPLDAPLHFTRPAAS